MRYKHAQEKWAQLLASSPLARHFSEYDDDADCWRGKRDSAERARSISADGRDSLVARQRDEYSISMQQSIAIL